MTAIGSVIGRPGQLAHPSCFRVTVLRCTPPPAFQKGIQQRTRDVSRCARQGKKHLHRHKPPTGDPDSSSPDGDSGQEAPSTSQPKYISSDPPGHRAGYVAIIGKPNAGKSTLLNAILGQKLSIVTPKAQTTRHRIIGVHSGPGFQCILLDTPGILRPVSQPEERNKLDEQMMRNVRRATRDAEAVLFLVDAGARPEDALPLLRPYCGRGLPVAVVLNKVDTVTGDREQELVATFGAEPGVDEVIPISALQGRNVGAVERWAVSQLPLGPSLYPKDTVSEHPERFFVAEIIREKIFQQYREEVPYCTSVQVMDYKERKAAKDLVQVVVFVEQESQKGIILGKGASALKAMATAARADIEQFLGRPVYLDMSVKVKPKWRSDADAVTGLGY